MQSAREVHTLAGAAVSDTEIDIPAGVMLIGASTNVNSAVTTDGMDDTWEAAFITGSTTEIATSGTLGAKNTKTNLLIVPEITTDVTNIRFTAGNSEDFDGGIIEVIVYFYSLTPIADAP